MPCHNRFAQCVVDPHRELAGRARLGDLRRAGATRGPSTHRRDRTRHRPPAPRALARGARLPVRPSPLPTTSWSRSNWGCSLSLGCFADHRRRWSGGVHGCSRLCVAAVTHLDTQFAVYAVPWRKLLEAAQRLVQVPVGGPTVNAAVVVQAAHVPVVIIHGLHETQGVEPENNLWAWHLPNLADADPLHRPIGIQGDSLSIPRYIADLLKSPSLGKSRFGHPWMISLTRSGPPPQERGRAS